MKTELFFLLLVPAVQSAIQTEMKTVRETVTLHSNITDLQPGSQILWSCGEVRPLLIAQIFRREIFTDYDERFRDRLQLDRQTGSLTISNLNTNDSGVYQLQIVGSVIYNLMFNLSVYTAVSKPGIRNTLQNQTVSKSCSVLCSVENGREVTLSWQREGETLSNTSSPDLNTPLSLPLEIEEYSSTYSCVAANLVTHTVTRLNMSDFCPHVDPVQRNPTWPIVVASSAVLTVMVIGSAIALKKQWKSRKTKHEYDRTRDDECAEITYAEVRAQPVQMQLSGGPHNGLDSEAEDRTVYAPIVV